MAAVDFDSLCAERDDLRNYVLVHAGSVLSFKEKDQPLFHRQKKSHTGRQSKERKLRHLTTTASCLESLNDVPIYETDDPPAPCPTDGKKLKALRLEIAQDFATTTLEADGGDWMSENQVLVYSRVRTLPVILQLTRDDTLASFGGKLAEHLEHVWAQLKISDPRAQGIAERAKDAPFTEGYPPNAFHTYWAIRFLREYRAKSYLPRPSPKMKEREAVARLWARRTLATQTSLISGRQRNKDAQQLAWALSTDVLCQEDNDQPTTADLQHTELYDAALEAFFSEQEDGRWGLYDPLFHYEQAGNAYCYTYETLAELLRLALRKKEGRVLRDHLRPYAGNLITAWRYARSTALELENGGLGWCSGHHPHRTSPEPWATAAVFSYLQNLRCLVGHWAAGEAKRYLSVQPAATRTVQSGEKLMEIRGDTWRRDGTQTVGRQLSMLFLHPIRATRENPRLIDPDTPLVNESRSAVLFGPPGTSKTTVVEGLAAALGWDYVEVHASNFLSEGMDSVPRQADAIFQKIMELDHCVILFDEIDELIRVRDGDGTDPYGRFLTTSMLPKLAKLWNQRRVLFFVATNDIAAADPAIKRSQRFDAAVFVPPPSFEKKRKRLDELLGSKRTGLTVKRVENALAGVDPDHSYFGVFAFLRWDQIDDLAHRVSVLEHGGENSTAAMKEALQRLGAELERTDWQPSANASSQNAPTSQVPPELAGDYEFSEMFRRWRSQRVDERRDYRRAAVLQLAPKLVAGCPDAWNTYGEVDGYVELDMNTIGALEMTPSGLLKLDGKGWTASDRHGTLSFK